MVKRNCENCIFTYQKDINFDESNPEYVYICEKDNHYVGYPEDAENQVCEKWGGYYDENHRCNNNT